MDAKTSKRCWVDSVSFLFWEETLGFAFLPPLRKHFGVINREWRGLYDMNLSSGFGLLGIKEALEPGFATVVVMVIVIDITWYGAVWL